MGATHLQFVGIKMYLKRQPWLCVYCSTAFLLICTRGCVREREGEGENERLGVGGRGRYRESESEREREIEAGYTVELAKINNKNRVQSPLPGWQRSCLPAPVNDTRRFGQMKTRKKTEPTTEKRGHEQKPNRKQNETEENQTEEHKMIDWSRNSSNSGGSVISIQQQQQQQNGMQRTNRKEYDRKWVCE